MKQLRETFAHDTWVMPYLRKYKGLLILVLFLGFMTFFSGGALMFNSGYLISEAARRPSSIIYIYVPVVLARAFGIARPVFRYIERLTSHNWVLRIVSDFRKKLYQTVERKATTIQRSHQTGDILSILADDIDHIENLYLRTVFPMVIGWLLYLFVVIGIGCLNWVVSLLLVLLLGIIVIIMPLASVATNGVREFRQHQIQHEFYTNLTDEVLGLGDWLISGRYHDFMKLQEKPIKAIAALRRKDHFYQWWRSFFVQVLVLLSVLVLLIWSGQSLTGSKAAADWIAAFALAIFPAVSPFLNMSQGMSEWPVYQRSIKRVNQLDQNQPREVPQEKLSGNFEALKIDHLTFKYPDGDRKVVNDISMTVRSGEKVALLGPSGTGKSTLLKLMVGDLTPTAGKVMINGMPVSALQKNRAELFGILDQQPYLFDTTVMNNVRLGNINASDDDVKKAIEAVGLKSLIESLPEQYETHVQEAGRRFSGGERQRLSLARILLQDAPIIILDEPTVSLDPITERRLLDQVFALLKDKTIIWVTHHLAGIKHVDQVRFLEAGRFDMQGTPETLYQTEARFRQLYDLDRGKSVSNN
ncbi:thiol reductant ABC exporter subunit CydC [Lentilactobacillus farraginis]|uniref:ABC superfamily ATP binding cassette transporter, ABC membrane protein n=1 Tax=Lentilactobacillus farraginis DSM 18382 = JCM 14108 TaxID=1423743 RepID=X0QCI5_9LACO|nr:thiol reductant ABC exporter subunit CydC [Lentilactobacillus farraginis]KRM09579.1 ABC superfamily ATP binding cassette transporter, ABC membrane protein [Lentilactobacillus farraginis DSM 18382 = JCM 14108]GAF36325.1 transport ATP-binding protein CydC [Lentilactobacillus farraginis DSM 18382 = JCM 14108]